MKNRRRKRFKILLQKLVEGKTQAAGGPVKALSDKATAKCLGDFAEVCGGGSVGESFGLLPSTPVMDEGEESDVSQKTDDEDEDEEDEEEMEEQPGGRTRRNNAEEEEPILLLDSPEDQEEEGEEEEEEEDEEPPPHTGEEGEESDDEYETENRNRQ